MSDTQFLTPEQVKGLVSDAVKAAVTAVNTVAPEDRPAIKAEAPAVHTRQRAPRLGRALKAMFNGSWQGAELERDISLAATELFDIKDKEPDSIVWVKSWDEARDVFDHMGEKDTIKHRDAIDTAVKAMAEGGTSYAITTDGGGGILVPPAFLQDLFEYALAPTVAVRRVPGIRSMPVNSNNVRLPRESVRAGGATVGEASLLTPQDATFAQQSINIEKQYAYRLFSNELLADATPPFMEFLANTVVRDLSIVQDTQFLRGNGTSPNIQGIIGYPGLTAGPSLGANGRTPTHDDLLDAVYNLEAVDARCDFFISHPRFVHTLRKIKDAEGRYIVEGLGVPPNPGANAPDATLLNGAFPVYKTTNLPINLTVGTSTDCETVILGDSSKVLILDRMGIELAVSRDIAFNYDQTAVRAIARSAIAILMPAAVSTITGVRP